MDSAGLVPVVDVLYHASLALAELQQVIEEDNKSRCESLCGRPSRPRLPGPCALGHPVTSEGAKAGKRADVDVLLAVSPVKLRGHGVQVHGAPNGVLLARHVPADAIVDVTALNRPGERRWWSSRPCSARDAIADAVSVDEGFAMLSRTLVRLPTAPLAIARSRDIGCPCRPLIGNFADDAGTHGALVLATDQAAISKLKLCA
jgi:hypothetical protein